MLKPSALVILFILSFLYAFPNLTVIQNKDVNEILPSNRDSYLKYLDRLLESNIFSTDSAQQNINQLNAKRTYYFSTKDIYSKASFHCEMANNYQQLGNTEQCFLHIDSALLWLPFQLFPEARFKTLELGEHLAKFHRNYQVQINFLKEMYESGYLSFQSRQLADILLDIADYYWNMHEYDESMKYCKKVIPIVKIQNYHEGKIRGLLIMYHNAHYSTNDSSWRTYLQQALELAEELGDSAQLSQVYYTIGYSHYRENEHQKAIEYYKKARLFEKDKGSPSELTMVIMQQLSYTLIDSVEAVNNTSSYIIAQAKKHNQFNVLGNAYRGRAWYFAKSGQRDSAVYYLSQAYEHRQKYKEKKNASPGFYYYLYEVAMLIPDYELALKYLNKSANQTRAISMETNAKELGSARADLDYQLQRERIERLTLENNLEHEKNKKQRILISGASLLILLGAAFLIFAHRKYNELKKSYSEVFKKNIELDKLSIRLKKAETQLNPGKNGNNNGNHIHGEETIYRKLKLLLEEKQVYKQPDISLSKLAKKLKTNTSYLSIIINNRFEEPFKSLVNRYRINEARKLLASQDYTRFTIEGIAEEVGYISRSTFYQSFKQITGLTPSQYIQNLKSKHPEETAEQHPLKH